MTPDFFPGRPLAKSTPAGLIARQRLLCRPCTPAAWHLRRTLLTLSSCPAQLCPCPASADLCQGRPRTRKKELTATVMLINALELCRGLKRYVNIKFCLSGLPPCRDAVCSLLCVKNHDVHSSAQHVSRGACRMQYCRKGGWTTSSVFLLSFPSLLTSFLISSLRAGKSTVFCLRVMLHSAN